VYATAIMHVWTVQEFLKEIQHEMTVVYATEMALHVKLKQNGIDVYNVLMPAVI
jgi:hypothetical protein